MRKLGEHSTTSTQSSEPCEVGTDCATPVFMGTHSVGTDCAQNSVKLIERNPPPGEGFLFTMFPDQEPGGRGPPSKYLYQVLRGGSS